MKNVKKSIRKINSSSDINKYTLAKFPLVHERPIKLNKLRSNLIFLVSEFKSL